MVGGSTSCGYNLWMTTRHGRTADGATRLIEARRPERFADHHLGDHSAGGGEYGAVGAAHLPAMSAAERLRTARGIPQKYRTDRRTFVKLVSEVVQTLPDEFRLTVLHEIGHYFGLGDDELP